MKYMVDLALNNGEKFNHCEYIEGGETWHEFKLEDGSIIHVPTDSIAYTMEIENEGEN